MRSRKFVFFLCAIMVFPILACTRTPLPDCHARLKNPPSGAVHPVVGQLDAYNGRNIALFATFFHEEVQLFVQGESRPFLEGIMALRETYGKMFRESPDLHCRVVRRIQIGNFVIDEEQVTGMRKGPAVHAVAIYEVQGARILKAWFIKGR